MPVAKLPAGAKPLDMPASIPHLEHGDEVYFQARGGPASGKVICFGAHGCMLEAGGKRHKVTYDRLLGHKVRVEPKITVVSDGEDGFVGKDETGRRRYFHDPLTADGEEEPMGKALGPRLLLFTSRPDLLLKAAVANRPGLGLQDVTDKRGIRTKRWKKLNVELPKTRARGDREQPAGGKTKFGTHNLGKGDAISFKLGALEGRGEIIGKPGAQGAHVRDDSGHVHKVLWSQVSGHKKPASGPKPAAAAAGAKPEIKSSDFKASEYGAKHDDPDVTPESIMAKFPADTAQRIAAVQERLHTIEHTIDQHKKGDSYGAERAKLHRQIIFEGRDGRDPDDPTKTKFYPGLLSPDAVKAATPAKGEKPTFTMLGGRGGSGKSALKGRVYDPSKAIVLDADVIKSMLPEYEGWNAEQVHEESSDILENVLKLCRQTHLNVVLDATMKTTAKALAKVAAFKGSGYQIEAHYMHLPRQVAAHRALERFLGKSERYVPTDVILGNTTNEQSFDEIRQHAHRWSFHDNNVPRGAAPKLIAHSDDVEG